jgi:hypothetical protein
VNNNQQPTTPDCQCAVDDQAGDMLSNISDGIVQQATDEANEKTKGGEGGGNWLIALANAMADIQTKFLDKAMDNMATMNENSDAAVVGDGDGEGNDPAEGAVSPGNKAMGGAAAPPNNDGVKPENPDDKPEKTEGEIKQERAEQQEFIQAQSQFQANMQMFNMMSNMTATTIKALGEGLTSLARKQ